MKLFTTNPRSWADLRAIFEGLEKHLTGRDARVDALEGRVLRVAQTGDIACAGAAVTTFTVTHNLGLTHAVAALAPLIVTSSPGAKPTVSFDSQTTNSFRLLIYNPNAGAATVQVPYALLGLG